MRNIISNIFIFVGCVYIFLFIYAYSTFLFDKTYDTAAFFTFFAPLSLMLPAAIIFKIIPYLRNKTS
jgi:hypothetical protein